MASFISSRSFVTGAFLKRARIREITSPARFPSRIMRRIASRASARLGESPASHRRLALALARYANCDGVFVLVCSGSLEADGVKKLIEIVYNLLIEPIQLSSFVVLEFGVSPVRLEQPGSER